jgi:hypothetical protein
VGHNRTIDDASLLAEELAQSQGLELVNAHHLVAHIATADDDIWIAAVKWAKTKQMPTSPTVEGENPSTLAARFKPSQVFTALMGLRADPVRATHAMRNALLQNSTST